MIKAVIFDKDGTLFDFSSSWGAWTENLLAELVEGGADGARLAAVLGYDVAEKRFALNSPVIAHTTPEIADIMLPHLPGVTLAALSARMDALSAIAPLRPAVDLPKVLGALRARGLVLGLATNDTEMPAREHLRLAGVLDLFSFVAGCDSGYGGKPAAGQLLAFTESCGLDPSQIAMVGDSLHDLEAGRAAGMHRVGVLTGIAMAADLAPFADVLMADIGGLQDWIDGLSAA